jgi:hypothetical protein
LDFAAYAKRAQKELISAVTPIDVPAVRDATVAEPIDLRGSEARVQDSQLHASQLGSARGAEGTTRISAAVILALSAPISINEITAICYGVNGKNKRERPYAPTPADFVRRNICLVSERRGAVE